LAAGVAGFRIELALITKFDERRKLRRRLKIDAAAAAAVAAGRTAFGNVLLSTPCNNSVAAVSGCYGNRRFVNELQECVSARFMPRKAAAR
jgi:hypothetical protein